MTKKQNTSLAKTSGGAMTLRDVNQLRVEFDESKYNVLAPTVHMPGGLPAGTRLVVTEVKINPDASRNGPKEVFPLPGGMLLPSKVSLDRISNAAGISWVEERRQDSGNHPHYVEMFVRGKMTDFDGTTRELTGHKAVDLREDAGNGEQGKDYAEIVGKAQRAKPPRDPSNQLMEARKFIQEIAVSKAKNRAIAAGLGIKRGYTRAELNKPFVVPKLSMDPNNPMVQNAVMANMVGETAVRAMFGPSPRDAKVVDAVVEPDTEPAVPSNGSDGDEPADNTGTSESAGSDPTDLPPMEEQDERPMPTQQEWRNRLSLAWQRARKAGMDAKAWGEFVRVNTGKANEDQLTFDDLDCVDSAVEAFAEANQ